MITVRHAETELFTVGVGVFLYVNFGCFPVMLKGRGSDVKHMHTG